MHFTKVGSLLALAGLSQAFLIPSTMSLPATKAVDAIPFEAQAASKSAEFMLDCPGCPVVLSTTKKVSAAVSKLKINVAVQKNEGSEDSLYINNLPVLAAADSFSVVERMHADQLIQGPDNKWVVASHPELGYALRVTPFHDRKHKGMTAYDIHWRITEVANEVVRWTTVLAVKVIKNEEGRLMIANTHVSGPHSPPKHDYVAVISAPECNSFMCRWKVTLFEKVGSFKKGCGRKGGPPNHPRPNGIFKGPHGRPRPAGFEHGRFRTHHRHGRHSTVARVINDIFNYIIIPMVIGAALGIIASIIGAVVGHLIVLVWRVLFRRGQRGQCSRQREETDVVKDGEVEKIGLMDDQEAPPVYEDAVVVEKVEQK